MSFVGVAVEVFVGKGVEVGRVGETVRVGILVQVGAGLRVGAGVELGGGVTVVTARVGGRVGLGVALEHPTRVAAPPRSAARPMKLRRLRAISGNWPATSSNE